MALPEVHQEQQPPEGAARAHLEELASAAQDPHSPDTIRYAEFMGWTDEDMLAEWVDGKIEMSSPASLKYQQIGGFLYSLLLLHARLYDLGEVLNAPFQIKLSRSARAPDVMFLSKEHHEWLRNTTLLAPADLVVEIVSPESVARDTLTKLAEYQRDRVPEYWLIDPRTRTTIFRQLDAEGTYRIVPLDDAGIYHARAVPNFWLDIAWLWREPLPAIEPTLMTIAGQDYARYLMEQMRQQGLTPEGNQ